MIISFSTFFYLFSPGSGLASPPLVPVEIHSSFSSGAALEALFVAPRLFRMTTRSGCQSLAGWSVSWFFGPSLFPVFTGFLRYYDLC
jgi:hypothetical protein